MPRLLADSKEGAKAIPFALGKLRALRAQGFSNVTQHYEVMGFRVRVTINGADEVIEVRGGSAGYEFWVNDDFRAYPDGLGSSGHVNVRPTDSDGVEVPGEMTSDFAQGHAVHLTKKGKAVARYSTSIAPDTSQGQDWPLVSPRRLTTVTPSGGTKAEPGWFYTKWSWQDQKMFEHSWWKGNKGQFLVTSAVGFGYGLANNAPSRGPGSTAYSYRSNYLLKRGGDRQADPLMGDAGFDIKTCAYTPSGVQVGASRQQGANVWYRRAAVQTVALPGGGTRDYVVHSDTHGNFTIWPLGEYQNVSKYPELYQDNPIAYADLPPSVAKVFAPDYPAWVSVPDPAESVDRQHWTWQFDKSGTRCVSIPHKKVESWVWVWTRTKGGGGFSDYLVDGKPLMTDGHYNNFYSIRAGGGYSFSAPGRNADGSIRLDPSGNDWVYQRVREYRKPRDSSGHVFSRAYMIGGVLVGCSLETGSNPTVGGVTTDWKPVPAPDLYEPAFTYLPGLVELGIKITASDTDPYDFTVSFGVLQDEFYDDTAMHPKRYFVDAAYYVATPRTRALDAEEGLADDDLLVAEVEVFFTPGEGATDEGPRYPADPTDSAVWRKLVVGVQHAQGGLYLDGIPGPASESSGRRYHDHIDEPYLESSLTGRFRADGVYAYYTVRKHETQAMVQRLCLLHNERWDFEGLDILTEFFFAGPDTAFGFTDADDVRHTLAGRWFMGLDDNPASKGFEIGLARAKYLSDNHMPATFVTHIDVADLRFLNFVTRTYQRPKGTPSSYSRVDLVTEAGTPTFNWRVNRASYRYINQTYPNHHLRIRGQSARSIRYGPDVPELGTDPAANRLTPPADAVLLPSIPRGGTPCGNEGAALAMQQEFAARFITPSLLPGNAISAHPGGHWAVCMNRTQGEVVFDGPEELPQATGTLLAPLPGSTEAVPWFDAIHVHGGKDTTHKDVFNKAFGQSRDYSYWADPDGTGDGEEFGGFMSGALWIMN